MPPHRNGFKNYDPSDPPASAGVVAMKSRELLVEERMHAQHKEFVDVKAFNFFVGTWNVNGRVPDHHESLEPWLTSGGDLKPHFYILGFQELDLEKRAYVLENSVREMEWQNAVERTLNILGKYKRVKVIRLVGMMLLVYVQAKHAEKVTNVAAAVVGTGIMGWMGNKGGVGVRLEFHDSELCFICSHFAAHTEEVERRNEDFRNICDRMVFNQLAFPKFIKDHDIIVWLGDFNYRIARLDRKQVQHLIENNFLDDLAQHDQLQQEMALQKVFHGFQEGKIKFRPTYKYDTGTDFWDSSEKSRVPSWCDRVLWKHKDGEKVELLLYDSKMEMRVSDHKPVIAVLKVGIKVVDTARRKIVLEKVLKNIDREENLFIPNATIDTQEFKFGDVTFIQQITKTLTIANTGQVPLIFEFIPRPGASGYCKDWLKISPQRGQISQGQVCYVELQMYVDKKTAAKLTVKEDTLDDILVLHLDGGKDFFVTIQGQYIPSCFGTSLEALVASPHAMRAGVARPSQELIQFDEPELSDVPVIPDRQKPPPDVPLEAWLMLSHLYAVSTHIPDLFLQPGPPDQVEKIRDHLDSRFPLPLPGSGHSVAEALLLFFDALPEPLVPYRLYNECLEASQNLALCKLALEKFPKVHRGTFKAFIVLLRELQKHWETQSSDVGTLEVIADLIMRPPHDLVVKAVSSAMGAVGRGAIRQATSKKKTAFIQQFLLNKFDYEPVFPKDVAVSLL